MKRDDVYEGLVVTAVINGRDLEGRITELGTPSWPGLRWAARLEFDDHPATWVQIADLKETS